MSAEDHMIAAEAHLQKAQALYAQRQRTAIAEASRAPMKRLRPFQRELARIAEMATCVAQALRIAAGDDLP